MLNLAKRVNHWVWDPNEERKRLESWQQEQERLLQVHWWNVYVHGSKNVPAQDVLDMCIQYMCMRLWVCYMCVFVRKVFNMYNVSVQEQYQREQEKLKKEWEKAQLEVEEEERKHIEEVHLDTNWQIHEIKTITHCFCVSNMSCESFRREEFSRRLWHPSLPLACQTSSQIKQGRLLQLQETMRQKEETLLYRITAKESPQRTRTSMHQSCTSSRVRNTHWHEGPCVRAVLIQSQFNHALLRVSVIKVYFVMYSCRFCLWW